MGTQKCQILYQCHMGHVLVRVLVSGMGAGVQFDKKMGGDHLETDKVSGSAKKRERRCLGNTGVTTQERYLRQM
jgi:hypothetical protein